MRKMRRALWGAFGVVAGLYIYAPAQAADLGGDCCADLEERVAELEATTVRKGNRKVSVKVSGFVSKSVMFWDDGVEENAYVGDTNGSTLASNFSITGSAQIASGWSAGYDLVIEADGGTNISNLSQDADNGGVGIGTLVSSMWIKSDTFGKLSWGKQSQASDNAALLPDLSGTLIQANYVYAFHGGAFKLRQNGVELFHNPVLQPPYRTGNNWSALTPCATSSGNAQGAGGISMDCNGAVLNNVRYDTPTIAGFSVSTSWGEDDFWDVAVNYSGQWGDVKVKAAYAFTNTTDGANDFNTGFDTDLHQVGASFLHVPTGIFAYGAYITEDVEAAQTIEYTDNAWYVKAGIQLKLTSLGMTVLYGEYGEVEAKEYRGALGQPDEDFADFRRYGVGIVQYIDSAAMQLHAMWKRNEGELHAGAVGNTEEDFTNGVEGDVDDLDMFIVGGTIFF